MTIEQNPAETKSMQFTGFDSFFQIVQWMKDCGDTCAQAGEVQYHTPIMLIHTGAGTAAANPGDWIVRGEHGFRVSATAGDTASGGVKLEAGMTVGARLEVGPWLERFAVLGVVTCASDGCESWMHTMADGTNGLDFWHLAQRHMFDHRHVGDSVTITPIERSGA